MPGTLCDVNQSFSVARRVVRVKRPELTCESLEMYKPLIRPSDNQ